MKQVAEAIEFWMPTMTDAEWAAHDERVRIARADLDKLVTIERSRELIAKGWPVRAVEEAMNASPIVHATQVMRAWDFRRQNIIILSGASGVGKTVAAAVWALERTRVAPEFLHAAEFAAASRYDKEDRNTWEGATALVVDDLGVEYADAKGNFQASIDELVNRFYSMRRPLVITTNMVIADFKQRYQLRIVDRMREAARFVACGGESLRKRDEP